MKKLFGLILSLLLLTTILVGCGTKASTNQLDLGNAVATTEQSSSTVYASGSAVQKHLLLNADGSYGGSYFDLKYGQGAPLNGMYDVVDSDYYMVNDFYNMTSTSSRTVYPHFSGYQQTMQDTSAIACLVALQNYLGKDVAVANSEYALMTKYEQLNNATIYNNGTTPQGLANLVSSLGYTVEATSYTDPSENRTTNYMACKDWLVALTNQGKYLLVRFQSPNGFGWKMMIGYDTMGTEDYFNDDVMIFAEPNDNYDHYQDGYTIHRAQNFYHWWRQVDIYGNITDEKQCVVINTGEQIAINRVANDNVTEQVIPEVHFIFNADGTYGGTTDVGKYGTGTPANGMYNHTTENYYKYTDYYNMTSQGSRMLIGKYIVKQQTMSSSCGICAMMSVLNYYGEDINTYDEIWLCEKYEALGGKPIKGVGTVVRSLLPVAEYLGYTGVATYTSRDYQTPGPLPTFDSYKQWIKYNLANDRPMVICISPRVGHYVTIIGYDDMGTDHVYDDVVILADSSDSWDHFQNGYNTYPAMQVYRQFNNGGVTLLQPSLVIYDKD